MSTDDATDPENCPSESAIVQSQDDRLVVLLAAGATQTDAAATVGVSAKTVSRRLRDPQFANRVQETRAHLFEQSLGRLADGATEAVDTLRGLLASDEDRVRLSAAAKILELGLRARDAVEIERRVAALESIYGD